jgi:iron complex transport system ATP-binding protein
MITAKNLNLHIGDKHILNDVNIEIAESKFTAVIGPNGAGKSSLLKCLTGSEKPSSGNIQLEGKNVESYTSIQLARKRAVLSQNVDVNFPFTVREIVMMGRSPHIAGCESINDHRIVEECLEKVDMLDFEDRQFSTLSGGEKQRVQLARVLTQLEGGNEKKYLFLDEPTSALDLKHQDEMMRLVKELIEKLDLTVFAIMHDINLAAKFADNVILLKFGRILAGGNTKETLTEQNLKSIYDIDISILKNNAHQLFYVG